MIIPMGHFTAIGMRESVKDSNALVINTCGQNDTSERGTFLSWTWANPTNRVIIHPYHDVVAVSVECLWQGTKIREGMTVPDPQILNGNWRLGKGRRPRGAWAGPGHPLITTPGEARRQVYLPAYRRLVDHWMKDLIVVGWIDSAKAHSGPIYLRDFDTGRGVNRAGPMSHAWVLAVWLNTGVFPTV